MMRKYIFEVRTRLDNKVLQSGTINSDLPEEFQVRRKIANLLYRTTKFKDLDWFVDTVEVPMGYK